MSETLMRWSVATVCLAGVVILIGASMSMNYIAWRGQGNAHTALLLGLISIAVDAFKSVLPIIVGWTWKRGHRRGSVIAAIFFCGCLAISLIGSLGIAAMSRAEVSGGHEAAGLRLAATERELRELDKQMAALGTARQQRVVEQLIEQHKQDRRWSYSGLCNAPYNETTRNFCKDLATLRTEHASAVALEQLRVRNKELQREMDALLTAGARSKADGQAEIIAKMVGVPVPIIQTSLSALLTLLVEFGASFGLFLAALPLRTRESKPNRVAPSIPVGQLLETRPRRLVRTGEKLVID